MLGRKKIASKGPRFKRRRPWRRHHVVCPGRRTPRSPPQRRLPNRGPTTTAERSGTCTTWIADNPPPPEGGKRGGRRPPLFCDLLGEGSHATKDCHTIAVIQDYMNRDQQSTECKDRRRPGNQLPTLPQKTTHRGGLWGAPQKIVNMITG